MNGHIMIVDDEEAIRDALRGLFEDEGYRVECAATGEEAVARFRRHAVDCVLLDIWMPGIDGLETLARLRGMDADVPVIMMSGHATIDTAVKATRQGAFDFLEKPLSSDRLLILVRNAVEKRRLANENRELKLDALPRSRQELIGESKAIAEARELIEQVACADAPVLILGEHGTGKAVAARMLHRRSRRAGGPFVAVHTASIPDARMDSELFGHEKGAFPGALRAQRGRFEAAQGGSIYFEELTDLSLAAQAKVLRVLSECAIQRLGGSAMIPVDVRVMAASSRQPEAAMRDGLLREDFYYRMNVATIRLPALRERVEDIPLLAEALAGEQAAALGGEPVRFTPAAMARMQAYGWPGNVRELRNYVERCHILRPGGKVDADDMPPLDMGAGFGANVPLTNSFHVAREAFERGYLLYHLKRNGWNVSRTAGEIGMERSQLHRKIRHYGLSPDGEGEAS